MTELEALRREVSALRQQLADAQHDLQAMARNEADAVALGEDGRPVLLADAQGQLRQSQQLLRSVFDSALDPMVLIDDRLRVRDANPAMCALLGLERADVVGRPAHGFVPHHVDVPALWQELVGRGRLQGEFPLRRADGSERVVELNAVARVVPGLHFGVLRDVTTRVEADRAVQRSEARFRTLIEKSHEGISIIDAHGIVRFASESAARILGLTRDDLVGRRFDAFLHPEDRQAMMGEHAQLARGGPEKLVQFRVLRADGAVRWVEGAGRPMLDHPDIRGVVGNFRDITDRKVLEHEREGFFRLSLDPLCVLGLDGYVRHLNPAWSETLGWSLEELRSQRWIELVHPEDREVTMIERRSLLEGQATKRFENRYRCKDGSYRRLQWAASLSSETGLIYAVARDVTEHRQMEQTLRESERRYRRIVDNASEGMLMYDADARVTFMNPSMARMLGCNVVECVGRTVSSFAHPDEREGLGERLERAAEAGTGEREELRLLRADGRDLWVALHVDRLQDESGRFESALAMMTDITAWHESREALRRSEAQLRQAQKMEAIGSLAGGIAHDFNNLLSAILSYTSLMMEDLAPGDPLRHDVEEVHRAGTRAAELTRQLLAFSRKQMLKPVALDLNQVLAGLEKMLSRVLGEHVAVRLITAPDLGNVFADQGQLEQVIMNLAVNARDAMPEGGTLTFETSRVVLDEDFARTHANVTPGPHVLLAVTDTGRGMDSETLQRIFEPFFTTKETGKGTGLGLSTVYGIVQQSGGHTWVYSEPGKGTTFKIYLPRTDRTAQAGKASLRPPPSLRGKETVLLVEDENQVRDVSSEILRRHGYRVLEAQSPGEAVLICEQFQGRIDLLLSDVVMPHMNGPDLAERLEPMRPGMRVLFMSGYTEDAIVKNGVLDGGLDFLSKPVLPADLLEKVREVLGRPD